MRVSETDFPPLEPVGADAAGYRWVEAGPGSRPELRFRLALAETWAGDPGAASDGDGSDWTPLEAFAEKPAEGTPLDPAEWAVVSVLWRRLEFEVPLDEWMAVELGRMQVDICTMRLWGDGDTAAIDTGGNVLGTLDRDGEAIETPLIARAIARLDGSNVFAVWCLATPGRYAAVRDHFKAAGASFQLLHPTGRTVEPTVTARTEDAAFEVRHPASWMHQQVPTPPTAAGKSALDVLLVKQNLLKGYVRIKGIDLTRVQSGPMDELLNDALEEMAMAGVTVQTAWSLSADPVLLSIPGLQGAFTATGALQDSPYELHFGVALRGQMLFCVTALVLPLQAEVAMCLRGHRTFAMALRSATPAN